MVWTTGGKDVLVGEAISGGGLAAPGAIVTPAGGLTGLIAGAPLMSGKLQARTASVNDKTARVKWNGFR
jgi:hypothetical protein